MHWEVEIFSKTDRDVERERIVQEFNLLTQSSRGHHLIASTSRGYLLEGELTSDSVHYLARELLVDSVVETCKVSPLGEFRNQQSVTVLLKPGVMDPVAQSVLETASHLSLPVVTVRTFRRYHLFASNLGDMDLKNLRTVLVNDAIEQIVDGPLMPQHLKLGGSYSFQLITIPLLSFDDDGLERLSREGMLALSLEEMKVVQAYFRELNREPTDVELETIAQTWSEHCSHKTLRGCITLTETLADGRTRTRIYKNLLKETIFAATQAIRERLGNDDWCVSVFVDNAGVVKFDEQFHVAFKVETHNHPSAIEPYGGANTGLGGVIRDLLGTGLGAKPICNTDVFCFAPPDIPSGEIPAGVIHPRRIMHGVVAGVRDYGNRMGIPTVNGAIVFDERYLANPLVFCGTVGLLPISSTAKKPVKGDLIIALGGRTGRDGIHGATFSSLELTHESETVSGGAVQIGNAITEKKLRDVILLARDRGLFNAITDCGAGGFSSAVGEMAADLGADVELDQVLLKYSGLSYTEVWISESQERMVMSVPPEKWPELQTLCKAEEVEAFILGRFSGEGRLRLRFQGHIVADLDMHFLHHGRPAVVKEAMWRPPEVPLMPGSSSGLSPEQALLAILSSYSVCSKEWVIRQYDHEVQGCSVVKPLVGVWSDGPSDAAVVMPVLGSWKGLAIGCGLNPRYGDIDPYRMAAAAIDEALRNVVAVGGDPTRTAILDNFCWGNIHDPAILGALVRAAEACRDVAIAYGTPFISGKDSLKNTFLGPSGERRNIPHTLLVSAIAPVADVRRCVTMDLKRPGHLIYLVGVTREELGGSHYHLVTGQAGGNTPMVDVELAPRLLAAVHQVIQEGLIRSCHDLSEGGLAVAIAEMAFAGNVGAEIDSASQLGLRDEVWLFSESTTRFLVEVAPEHSAAFEQIFAGLPCRQIGLTTAEPWLQIRGSDGKWLISAHLDELREAWKRPLRL